MSDRRPLLEVARECHQTVIGDPGDLSLKQLVDALARETETEVDSAALSVAVSAIAQKCGVSAISANMASSRSIHDWLPQTLCLFVRVREGDRDLFARTQVTIARGPCRHAAAGAVRRSRRRSRIPQATDECGTCATAR